jgi:hypothetical protein
MIQEIETEVLAVLRDVLSGDTRLSQRLTLLEPTKKLARMLGGSGASRIETHLSSLPKPHGDLSSHCSRETSGAQVTTKGDSRYATPVVPR